MQKPVQRVLVFLLLAITVSFASRASADDRTDARTHYQAGVKFYAAADYKSAIREFSTAQQLVPADLNNYNLALCYDKLGDAEPAVQFYREYLNKVPNADKRPEIEASIARLDAALKSAAAKKADEQKRIDDAKKAEEAKRAEEARKIEEAAKADEAKRAAEAAAKHEHKGAGAGAGAGVGVGAGVGGAGVGVGAGVGGAGVGVGAGVGGAGVGGAGEVGAGVATGVGSTGTPSTGQTVSTGDVQLDRVSAIDINAIRDQRVGGAGSGMVDTRGGPAVAATGPNGVAAGGGVGASASGNANGMAPVGNGNATAPLGPNDKPAAPQETPVYKKWWFWAVVAVSAYVVYSVVTTNSKPAVANELPPMSPGMGAAPGGVPLFHF